ncbi:MAG: hypothetical protein HY000_02380 [Planctomycetes bacterium]|nr:hypothetical protein [Planctomycetota bacterium]
MRLRAQITCVIVATLALWDRGLASAQNPGKAKKAADLEVRFPPTLPGGRQVVTFSSPELLKPPDTLRSDVAIAQTPPTIDLLYFPGQTYPGKP